MNGPCWLTSPLQRASFDSPDRLRQGVLLFSYTVNTSVGRALRCRRRYVVHLIDSAAQGKTGLRVLAVGADHLRAVDLSFAVAN